VPDRDVPDRDVPDRDVVDREVPDRDVPDRDVVERPRDVPDVERERDVPDVEPERAREVPDDEREVEPLVVPLLPVVFFFVLVPLRPVVERAELRDVPELDRDRDVPEDERVEPDRERLVLLVLRGEAALAREMLSSVISSPPDGSSPTCSGANVDSPKRSVSPSLLCSSK
jgi:hypothetical protein